MAKKKRNHNPNRIKARHSYSFAEIAENLNIHRRTVQSWHKQGLKVIDEGIKPYLVSGADLKQFLIAKRQKHKHTLQADEFFCPKCQKPRKSIKDKLQIILTDKRLGKTSKQVVIKGICEVCNTRLTRFSSDRKERELQEKGGILAENETLLSRNGDSSVNTDIQRGEL